MASDLLGRGTCPECGFASAHIKIKTDKAGANPYRHCPECGAQYFPRNSTQADNLRKQIKAAKIDTPPEPAPEPTPAPKPKPKPDPEPTEKYQVIFGVRVPA